MKTFEKALAIIIGLLIVSKLFFVSFITGHLVLIVLLPIITVFYFPFGISWFNQISTNNVLNPNSKRALGKPKKVESFIIGISFALIPVAILFSIIKITTNSFLLFAIFLNAIIGSLIAIKYLKSKEILYSQLVIRSIILVFLGALYAYTLSLSFVKIKYKKHPQFVEAYKKHLENPKDRALENKMNLEFIRATQSQEDLERYMKNNGIQSESKTK